MVLFMKDLPFLHHRRTLDQRVDDGFSRFGYGRRGEEFRFAFLFNGRALEDHLPPAVQPAFDDFQLFVQFLRLHRLGFLQ